MIDGKLVWLAAGGGSKRRYQYCSDNLGTIIYLRALQGHSGSNLIDPTLQDNVYDWTWNIPLHLPCGKQFHSSFNYQQWIDTWRSKFEQKTNSVSSYLLSQEMKVTETQNILTSLYHVSRDTCTKHGRDSRRGILGRYWSWNQGRISVLSNKIECNYSSRNTSSPLYFRNLKDWKLERSCMKGDICLFDHTPKISLKHDHNWTKGNDQSGFTVEHQPVGKLVQQSLGESQPNSLNPLKIERRNLSPKRLLVSCKENLVLLIDRSNTIEMKTNASWKIPIERGNLWKQARTKCKKLVLSNIVMTRTSSTLRLMTKTSTSTSQTCRTRDGETITWY